MRKQLRAIKKIFFPKKENHNSTKDINYNIGNYTIALPFYHKLPEYQSYHRNYDMKLKNIVNAINDIDGWMFDIGANVGDTAALLRTYSDSPICSIEGDPIYLQYLRKNARQLSDVTIIDKYITGRNFQKKNYTIVRNAGTAKLIDSESETKNIQFDSLNNVANILSYQNNKIKLLKTDTDGFDFDILLANKLLINTHKMALYFEYDITYHDYDYADSIELIDFLSSIGYEFIIYDNFGNLLTYIKDDVRNRFEFLNKYLISCKTNGGGIYYYDVFASIDHNIVTSIINNDKNESSI